MERKDALKKWLQEEGGFSANNLVPMQGDASNRRYFRLKEGAKSMVAMDAPPPEKCEPFMAIANALRLMAVHTPEIIMADISRGFLLLSDFGDVTLLKALTPQNADRLYANALQALYRIQSCRTVTGLTVPPFAASFMRQEWAWHKEWYGEKWLKLASFHAESALDASYEQLIDSALSQPQVFMHRDYHAGNLMVLPDERIGVLDFQDAFIGPLTYDLASLLRDCYIDWPDTSVTKWALHYLHLLKHDPAFSSIDPNTFLRWFDWMGVQRHIKALMTFARKAVRDRDEGYVKHMPRTLRYIVNVSARYPELKPLHDFYKQPLNGE